MLIQLVQIRLVSDLELGLEVLALIVEHWSVGFGMRHFTKGIVDAEDTGSRSILASSASSTRHLQVLSCIQLVQRSAIKLLLLSKDHRSGRHVESNGKSRSGKHYLEQPVGEQDLHHFFEEWYHSGMVKTDASCEEFCQVLDLRQFSIILLQSLQGLLTECHNPALFALVCQIHHIVHFLG